MDPSGLLVYLLYRARNGLLATDTMLKRLIRGSIQTGLFVAIFAMGDLISCGGPMLYSIQEISCSNCWVAVLSTSNLYGMFAIPLGRIYTTVGIPAPGAPSLARSTQLFDRL